ncbi:MAG: hypothetical protein ABIJ48_08535 [Actinomycetota bacterium]
MSLLLWIPADVADAQEQISIDITESDLTWPVHEQGAMGWPRFGEAMSGDSLCSEVGIGGRIATVRFDLLFDLAASTLTGKLSGTMAGWSDADWDHGSGSFTGSISDGWVWETPDGFAWGGRSIMKLSFSAAGICATVLDPETNAVVDRIYAEGEGSVDVEVEFAGGAGAWGAQQHGFRLITLNETEGSIRLGCIWCEVPVPFPAGEADGSPVPGPGEGGETGAPVDVGEVPSGTEPQAVVPPGDTVPGAEPTDSDDGSPVETDWAGLVVLVGILVGAAAAAVLIWAIARARAKKKSFFRGLELKGAPPTAEDALAAAVLEVGYLPPSTPPSPPPPDSLSTLDPPRPLSSLRFTPSTSLQGRDAGGRAVVLPAGRDYSWKSVPGGDPSSVAVWTGHIGEGPARWVYVDRSHVDPDYEGLKRLKPFVPNDHVPPPPPSGVDLDRGYGQRTLEPAAGRSLVLEEWDPLRPDRSIGSIGELAPGTYLTGTPVGNRIPVYDHTRGVWGWVISGGI